MTIVRTEPAVTACGGCGTGLAPSLLSCPACHRLVHSERLKELAARAETAETQDDVHGALTAWRASLDLLPPVSRQHARVSERIARLSVAAESARAASPPSGRWKWLAGLGPVGLLVWKFKFLLAAVLSKGKLLLLGLTKLGTLGSMLTTVALYWTQWGLWFADGLVASIYIHEMGHVAALRRYGIAASAPMFIPGLGALVRLKQAPVNPREDARIGLAGPAWGLGAAIVAAVAGLAAESRLAFAVAHTAAWINLFNLMPVWQLDGGRAYRALSTSEKWLAAAAIGVGWAITGDGLVLLVLLVDAGEA